jgi:hypothetical protein
MWPVSHSWRPCCQGVSQRCLWPGRCGNFALRRTAGANVRGAGLASCRFSCRRCLLAAPAMGGGRFAQLPSQPVPGPPARPGPRVRPGRIRTHPPLSRSHAQFLPDTEGNAGRDEGDPRLARRRGPGRGSGGRVAKGWPLFPGPPGSRSALPALFFILHAQALERDSSRRNGSSICPPWAGHPAGIPGRDRPGRTPADRRRPGA